MKQNDIVHFMEQKPIFWKEFLPADHNIEFRDTASSFKKHIRNEPCVWSFTFEKAASSFLTYFKNLEWYSFRFKSSFT